MASGESTREGTKGIGGEIVTRKKKIRNPAQLTLFPDWERVQDQLKKELERSGFVPHHKKLFISFFGGAKTA